ncbi:MAG: hypothetical protein HDT43_03700 [Ruminococcaceae bacterium]|nr:hypothetical protein [Oscillospiraceae bacterium]
MDSLMVQVQQILAEITQRYVVTESAIPREVLALKDEVMDIFAKAKQTTDSALLGQYEKRLAEIRERIA